MRPLRRALAGLGVLAVIFAAVDVALILESERVDDKPLTAALSAFIGLSFVGTGIFAWLRRPNNRFGALMSGVGFAWFVAGLTNSDDPLLFTLGAYFGPLYLVVVGHMLLAFPSGRIRTTTERAFAAVAYLDVLLVALPFYLLGGELQTDERVPENAFTIADVPEAASVFDALSDLIGGCVVVALIVMLVRRRMHATAPQRRAMAPILWTGMVAMVTLAVTLFEQAFGYGENPGAIGGIATLAAFALLPYAFLAGLLRSAYTRAGAVGELIERLSESEGARSLRDALADALSDPSLTLAYWSRNLERYVDAAGRPVDLPPPTSRRRAVTEVERDGVPIAAIVHDIALREERALVRAAGAAAALALENERLGAELRARVEELQQSRRKVIEAGMAERRALERNLHDGAQQRLVALSLQLSLARGKVRADPGTAERILDGARDELAAALEELRELARGIHPAVLTDRGLRPALESLAGRAPVPVELEDVPRERLPAPVEAAAYFVVAESLTNVAKYARARRATVRVSRKNGYAVVEVEDDGVGGADPQGGSGLRGLADRVNALDGRLEITSPPGRGTLVRARLPCG